MTEGTETRQRYVDRIERVQAHIHDHLDDPLDLDTLAEIACLSRFHWTRIYQAMTGESPVDTVRRLRLDRAARDLVRGERDIHRLALKAGYGSQAAFTRAFSSAFGQSPAAFRESGPHSALRSAIQENNTMAFPIKIRDLPVRTAVGLEHAGPYHLIGKTFGELMMKLQASGDVRFLAGMFGRYTDDPKLVEPDDLRSHACAFLSKTIKAAPPMEVFDVGGGPHAVLLYKGPYTSMQPAYDWLFGTWLPSSGRIARDAPLLEINLNTPDTAPPADLLTEICLPLEE